MSFVEFAIEKLKEKKFRITEPRKYILETMNSLEKPTNAYMITRLVHSKYKSKMNTSTAYRVLEILEKYNLVHFVKESQGYIKCQHSSCNHINHCHHQFVCMKCNTTSEIHTTDSNLITDLKKSYPNLNIKSHYLELMGLCNKCSD